MGIHQNRDGTFYAKCDFEMCNNTVQLKSTDFWDAKDEAKKLGFMPVRDKKQGKWVNFCTRFCETCYFAPQATIKIKKK